MEGGGRTDEGLIHGEGARGHMNDRSSAVPAEALREILDAHGQWLKSAKARGKRADLRGADLANADLKGVGLRRARLVRATLSGADLRGARLATGLS